MIPRAEAHPRPRLERATWECLNGAWDFALDREGAWRAPEEVTFDRRIVVPFAPETRASGVGDTGFFRTCWYRRKLDVAPPPAGERVLLAFGAVDYAATVWIDGDEVASHEGGSTPFEVDITPYLGPRARTLVVRACDDPHDLTKPRGKQDWQLEPHSIWYPRTTGIWQTVWLERVPEVRILNVQWTANLEHWEMGIDAEVESGGREDLRLRVVLSNAGKMLADDTYAVIAGEVNRRIGFSDPGIDDFRNELLWRPSNPTVIDAVLELWGHRGELLDRVTSYTALRSINIQGDRFVLNGRAQELRLVLDQGYWPDSGLTAPSDAALERDVELAKAMGFNGVRKHQKVEDPRYHYWATRLGLMVWEEMPSAYRFTSRSVRRLVREWTEVITRDRSEPCIVAWVPLNESWGVPDLPSLATQRHYVQALYHLTHTLDPSRPVIGNDGWESVATDVIGIHDYDADPERLAARYSGPEVIPQLFKHGRPGGRLLIVEGQLDTGLPVVLSEFGGLGYSEEPGEAWAYSACKSPDELERRYTRLLSAVRSCHALCGFCYTQFADTYQERNGLLRGDRTPKFALDKIRQATRGRVESDEAPPALATASPGSP